MRNIINAWRARRIGICAAIVALASAARGDVYQWEYVDPQNPELGKKQSSTLVPSGNGVFAGPGAYLGLGNLTKAYLQGMNLRNAQFEHATLSTADLSQANLTGTSFRRANVTNADFTGSQIQGASFHAATGFTAAQLYSTASYMADDLRSVVLIDQNLTGWNFAGKDLTGASLWDANLTGADFTGATIRGVVFRHNDAGPLTSAQLYSTASYQVGDLVGVNLAFYNIAGWNFANQNLTYAELGWSTVRPSNLTGANFTNAVIRGASFQATTPTGFTAAQLYSTASYQSGDLVGVRLSQNDLSGWDFSNQDLTNARFQAATLTGADFSNATVRGTSYYSTTDKGFTAAQLYSTASYQEGDLAGIILDFNNLSGWSFAGQDLTSARFYGATLVNTDFSGAVIRGVDFGSRVVDMGFTHAQLASTASFQSHDLRGVSFRFNTLDGWDFSNQNLCGANFHQTSLDNVNFTGAIVRGTDLSYTTTYEYNVNLGFTAEQLYSTASYQEGNLSGIGLSQNDLMGWDFSGQNLTGARFSSSTLLNADFTGAVIRDADLTGVVSRGFSADKLYSTASYLNGTLGGIDLTWNDLSGWDFASQSLANASFFQSNLSSADFSHADLRNSQLQQANVTGTNFEGADLRGAYGLVTVGAITQNAIHLNGQIQGLDLTNARTLVVRDHDGNPNLNIAAGPGVAELPGVPELREDFHSVGPIAVHVLSHFATDSTSVLQLRFEEDAWDSLISFAPGIPVELSGMLELGFAADVDIPSQIGRTIRIFDWTGVSPNGQFTVISPHSWDLSLLYSTGEVTLLPDALPGDYNGDGRVDGGDYVTWRNHLGTTFDLNGNGSEEGESGGVVDLADYAWWKLHYGEPNSGTGSLTVGLVPDTSSPLITVLLVGLCASCRRRT